MDTAMTQDQIKAARDAAVAAHGPVVETWGMGDSIVFRHQDGAQARLTWDDRQQVRGWVFAML